MRTFSHAIITAAVAKPLKLKSANYIAALVGSVLPDIPLYILTTITMLTSPSWAIGMERMHSNYETKLLWISSHNLFHSLPILGLLCLIALLLPLKYKGVLLWFSAGAVLHTVIDIFTHAGDGPLFLFPISMSIRFDSPVSYWDPEHYGVIFTRLEYALDGILLIGLLVFIMKRKFSS